MSAIRHNRRAVDRLPLTDRLTSLFLTWRCVIRRDPALQENIVFALCAVMFLAGIWMGAK